MASQASIILVDATGGERAVLWRQPEGLALRADELDRSALVSGTVLLMDADEIETAIIAARWAHDAGVVVVLDVDIPGPRTPALLRSTDVAIVTDGFPQALTQTRTLREALPRMAEMGPAVVAATRGAQGATAYVRGTTAGAHASGEWFDVEPFRVRAVDTTSAGDLFHAGFIYGLLQQWPMADVWRFAAAAAALECTQLGGRAAIPTREQTLALIAQRR